MSTKKTRGDTWWKKNRRIKRAFAVALTITMVIGMLSAMGGVKVAKADGDNSIQSGTPDSVKNAMTKIYNYLKHDDYQAWVYRSKTRITQADYNASSKKNWYCQATNALGETYYYRNTIDADADRISYYDWNNVLRETKRTVGSCSWCALRDLLNRRVALEYDGTGTFNSQVEFFTFEEVCKVVSGNSGVTDAAFHDKYLMGAGRTPKGSTSFIYIDGYGYPVGADHFNNQYKHTAGNKIYDYTFTYKNENNNFDLSSDLPTRKTQLKNLLNQYPEGILVYDNQHGYLLTGYYENGAGIIHFYAHDTGDDNYGKKTAYLITEEHIKTGYNYSDEDAIIKGIKAYGYISSPAHGTIPATNPGNQTTPTVTPTANNVTITNLHLGDPTPVTQIKVGNKCALRGTVSGTGIKTVEAFVATKTNSTVPINYTDGGQAKVSTTVTNSTYYAIVKGSAIDNGISCGRLPVGDYYLVVRALDNNGNQIGIAQYGFQVVSSIPAPTPTAIPTPSNNSMATITNLHLGDSTPVTQLKYGSGCALRGTISGTGIKTVEAYIATKTNSTVPINYTDGGQAKVSTTVTNSTYYAIVKGSAIDNGISCGRLPVGDYYLVVRALDNNGNQIGIAQYGFQVVSGNPTNATATITNLHLGDSTPVTQHKYGYGCAVRGTISGTGIKTVEAYIATKTNSTVPINYVGGGQAKVSTTVTNSTYYAIVKGSAIDNGISCSKIPVGDYYLVVRVFDNSGNQISTAQYGFKVTY